MSTENEEIRQGALPSVQALAFLGDAVCSLYVRERLVREGISHAGELNRRSLLYVTAERQAEMLDLLSPLFTEAEQDVYRRAFNSGHLQKPKRAGMREYRAATGLEAVLGMHRYLGNEERLRFLLQTAMDGTSAAETSHTDTIPKG